LSFRLILRKTHYFHHIGAAPALSRGGRRSGAALLPAAVWLPSALALPGREWSKPASPQPGQGKRKTAPDFLRKPGAVFMVLSQSPLGREPGKMVHAGEKQIWPQL